MRVKPGVKQMTMKGNTVVASGQQQHPGGKIRVGMVQLTRDDDIEQTLNAKSAETHS